jgi:hypothetical protein
VEYNNYIRSISIIETINNSSDNSNINYNNNDNNINNNNKNNNNNFCKHVNLASETITMLSNDIYDFKWSIYLYIYIYAIFLF